MEVDAHAGKQVEKRTRVAEEKEGNNSPDRKKLKADEVEAKSILLGKMKLDAADLNDERERVKNGGKGEDSSHAPKTHHKTLTKSPTAPLSPCTPPCARFIESNRAQTRRALYCDPQKLLEIMTHDTLHRVKFLVLS